MCRRKKRKMLIDVHILRRVPEIEEKTIVRTGETERERYRKQSRNTDDETKEIVTNERADVVRIPYNDNAWSGFSRMHTPRMHMSGLNEERMQHKATVGWKRKGGGARGGVVPKEEKKTRPH